LIWNLLAHVALKADAVVALREPKAGSRIVPPIVSDATATLEAAPLTRR
jgi:hypothetical protein